MSSKIKYLLSDLDILFDDKIGDQISRLIVSHKDVYEFQAMKEEIQKLLKTQNLHDNEVLISEGDLAGLTVEKALHKCAKYYGLVTK